MAANCCWQTTHCRQANFFTAAKTTTRWEGRSTINELRNIQVFGTVGEVACPHGTTVSVAKTSNGMASPWKPILARCKQPRDRSGTKTETEITMKTRLFFRSLALPCASRAQPTCFAFLSVAEWCVRYQSVCSNPNIRQHLLGVVQYVYLRLSDTAFAVYACNANARKRP